MSINVIIININEILRNDKSFMTELLLQVKVLLILLISAPELIDSHFMTSCIDFPSVSLVMI